jgi:PAS domain S-box-containing protein
MSRTETIEELEYYLKRTVKDQYDGTAIIDAKGELTYVSASLIQLLGYKKKDLYELQWFDLIQQEEEAELLAKFLKLSHRRKKKAKIQHQIIGKNKQVVWVNTLMVNMLHDPVVNGIVCHFVDITTQKEAEEEFNLVYEESNDAIFLVDYFTKSIKSCNTRAIELFERKHRRDFIGEKISVLWNDLWSNRLFNDEMEALESGILITREQEYCTRKANKFWGNTTISLIELPTSKVFVIRVTDMREQLKESRDYELAINQFAASLIDSLTEDEIVWGIARSIGEILEFEDCVIYTTNKDGKKLTQRASFGVKNPEGKMIKNATQVSFGHGIAGSVAQTRIAEIVNDTSRDPRYVFDEFNGCSEMAVPIIYEGTLLGVIDSESSKRGFFTNYHMKVLQTVASFSAVKIMQARANVQLLQNEKKLQFQNDELKKINTELDRFVYSTSHDLRAPLANIAGLIEVIKFQKPNDEIEHCLDLMEKSIHKLDDFITDILRYSRNKRVEIKREEIDFKVLIEESLSSLGYYDKSIAVGVHVTQKKMFISDRYRLQIILNNLISNAFRYRKEGEGSKIDITVKVQPKRAVISVVDNGIGIEKVHIPKIFDMFYRATNKTAGSGLGLFIVKETVGLLKGGIRVKSTFGEGADFELEVPSLEPKKG